MGLTSAVGDLGSIIIVESMSLAHHVTLTNLLSLNARHQKHIACVQCKSSGALVCEVSAIEAPPCQPGVHDRHYIYSGVQNYLCFRTFPRHLLGGRAPAYVCVFDVPLKLSIRLPPRYLQTNEVGQSVEKSSFEVLKVVEAENPNRF